jgi:hypothetical protein
VPHQVQMKTLEICHIGTTRMFGLHCLVSNSLRVIEIPTAKLNKLTKTIEWVCNLILLTVIATLLGLRAVQAAERPQPPNAPQSTEDCQAFQRRQVEYSKAVIGISSECNRRQLAAKSQEFVSFTPSCGGLKVTSYRACSQEFDASWCAWIGFIQQYNECMKTVDYKSHDQKEFDEEQRRLKENQDRIERQLILEQCKKDSVFPKVPDAKCDPPK